MNKENKYPNPQLNYFPPIDETAYGILKIRFTFYLNPHFQLILLIIEKLDFSM